LFSLCLLLFGCENFFQQKRENILVTGEVTEVARSTAQVSAALFDVGDDPKKKIIAHGHVWSVEDEPTIDDATDFKEDFGAISTFGDYSTALSGLTEGTEYFVRAYVQNGEGITYGRTLSFVPGLVYTRSISNIAKNTAQVRGELNPTTTIITSEKGFEYWASDNFNDKKTSSATNTEGVLEALLQGLNAETTYFVRVFVKYDGGKVTYGETLRFETDK
jgi:hypothetical protein